MRTLVLALLLVLTTSLTFAGCQSDGGPRAFKPPEDYNGAVRAPASEVLVVRPGEADPGPYAEYLGRYMKKGDQLSAKKAIKLAKNVGANFIVYSSTILEPGRVSVSGPFQRLVNSDAKFDNDVLFYRDPALPGLEAGTPVE